MPDHAYAEIELQVGSTRLHIRGAESFVEKKFEELEATYLSRDNATSMAKHARQLPTNDYTISDLYSIDAETGEVSIHGKIPGNSKSERMKNVALVVLYCLASGDPTPNAIVKKACIDQACLDQKNFATTIKKDNDNFITNGKGSNWSVKLTIFGKQKAESILKGMLDEQTRD